MWDPITNERSADGNRQPDCVCRHSWYPIIINPQWGGWSGENGAGLHPVDVTNQTAAFRAFLGFGPLPGTSSGAIAMGKTALTNQAPYTPTALVASMTQWEVNDPLVHYLASDLAGASQNNQPAAADVCH